MYLLEVILLIYFAFVTSYSFFFAIAAIFYKSKKVMDSTVCNKIAVLIPAYKEDAVIPGVAEQALSQNYPKNKFDVVVIADSLQPSTLEKLRKLPIKVIEVVFEKSTKVRALNKAMETIGDSYDCAAVLDADNLMEPHFLRKMNNLYNLHYKAIQGRRAAKNENTKMAFLDGLSETINNYVQRQGSVTIGLSAPMSGSGMFFDYKIFSRLIGSMDAIGGFDRELEYKFIELGIPVYYAKDIVVYDEKVEKAEVFEKQRTRWLSSQFVYLNKYFVKGCKELLRGNINYFNATVLRNIQLPRLINLGTLFITLVFSLILQNYVEVDPFIWFVLLLMNGISIMLAIPKKHYNMNLVRSAALVPMIFGKMVMLFFRLKGANKNFIHTPHGSIAHPEAKNA